MIGLTITGLVDVQKMFSKLGEEKLYVSTVQDVGKNAKEYAHQMCPVDTGTLRDSIFLNSNKDGFELGANAPYAVFNEYGSIYTPIGSVKSPKAAKKTGFRPFIRPSIYRATREVDSIFGQKLAEITSHGGR